MPTVELKPLSKRKKLNNNEVYKLGSPFLRSAKYSVKLSKLTVEFRNESVYCYYGISKKTAENFINAKSCSSFFATTIRKNKFKKVA